MDAPRRVFSPVRRMIYAVEHSTDLDRLVLDIATDGSITPCEALSQGPGLRPGQVTAPANLRSCPRLGSLQLLDGAAIRHE